MAAVSDAFNETVVSLAGIRTQVRRGGDGAPLLVIHGEFGVPGWLESFRLLGENYDVVVPSLPGYGGSERPDWIMGVHDVAAWISWFFRASKIQPPVNVVGFSMGGWIAAELAVIAPQLFKKLVLVGAMGVKPQTGEIFDYFLESGPTGIRRSFHAPDKCAEFEKYWGRQLQPDDLDLIEQNREMTCRIAWKPYMHSLTLPAFLPSIDIPSLVVWGRQDAIVPLASGEAYVSAIPGAQLVAMEGCGHMPEMEAPERFAAVVREFLEG